ncbi:MAG: DUF642 domain-containing protein [Bacteroidota bacterium]
MKKVYLLLSFSLISYFLYGQGPDCSDALVICNDGQISFTPSGPGIDDFASANNFAGCLSSDENQSAWYYFEMNADTPPGIELGFTIDPNGGSGEDYDFAIYGPDVECDNLGFPLRCSYASASCGFCPETGLGMGATDFSEGAGGNGFVAPLNVNPNQGFYLVVDNWLGSSTGFNLDWTGPGAPYLNCNANPTCELEALPIPDIDVCEEAAPFTLTGGAIGGLGAVLYAWTGDPVAISYLDNPNSPTPTVTLPSGFSGNLTYTLTVMEGSCMDMANVLVNVNPLPIISFPPTGPFCADDAAQTLIADPPGGVWGGAANGLGQIDPSLLGPGTYTATYMFTDAIGCSNDATVDFTINESPTVTIIGDLDFCASDGFTVLNAMGAAGDGTYTYFWDTPQGPTSGGSVIASQPGIYSVSVEDGNLCQGQEMVQVSILPDPDVLIFPPDPLCEADGLYVLNAIPFGGVWDTSTGIVDATGTVNPMLLGPGTFSVSYSYTDGNGCEATADIDFSIAPAPMAMASAGGPYCEGDLAQLFGSTNAAGPVIYTWSGPGGFTSSEQNPANVILAGTYALDITVNGCPAPQVTVDISFAAAPDAAASNNGPYCRDDLIELFGSTSAVGNVTYSWTGPGGFSSNLQNPINATASGTYTLTVSVDGCPSPPALTDVMVMEVPDATAANSGPYCEGDNIQLFGSTLSPGLAVTYTWTGPNNYFSNLQNPTDATVPGTYTLVVDVDGCSSDNVTTIVEITPVPVAVATNNGPFCYDSPIQLNGSALGTGFNTVYTWTGPNNYFSNLQNPTDALFPGIYTLEVSIDGCPSVPTTTEVQIIQAPDAFAGNDGPYCPDNPVINLMGETPTFGNTVTYSWTGPNSFTSSEQNPGNATESGTYTLIVNVDGCPSFPVTTEVNFYVAPSPNITGGEAFCEGGVGQLNGGDGYLNYQWSGGLSGQFIDITLPGIYELTVTDFNGCTGTTSIDVQTFPLPTTTIDGNPVFCEGLSTLLDAGFGFASYEWSSAQFGQIIEVSFSDTYTVTITDNNGCSNTASIDVMMNENPEPMISGSLTFCDGTSTTLDAGTGFASYIWSDGSTDQDLEVNMPGNYAVTVTNANGCIGTTEVVVEQSSQLEPLIAGATTFCDGLNTTLDVGAGFTSYLWSDGTSGQSIDVDASGTYSVTVSDATGCTGIAEATVVENPLPTANISGNQPICTGDMISLDAGGGFANYLWSDGTNNQNLEVSEGGTYAITVTDSNGCTATTQVNVVENANPTPNIIGPAAFCEGSTITLDADAGYSNYLWSDGSTASSLDVGTGGTYSLTVTNTEGCTGIASFSVTANTNPSVNINGNNPICNGEAVTLEAGSGFSNYLWSDGTGNADLEVTNGGTYGLTVTDGNGCTGTAEVTVLENANPVPVISGPTEFCEGTTADLDLNNTYANYQWTGGGTGASLEVSATGIYMVTVTDANGCSGIADFSVTQNTNPTVNISGNQPICNGEMVTLEAGAGYTDYVWSDNSLNSSLEVTNGGNYSVTVTDANGCTGVGMIEVIENANPTTQITGPDSFCENEIATLDAGMGFSNYLWSNGSTNSTLDVSLTGTYVVTVTDANGCTGVADFSTQQDPLPSPSIAGSTTFCAGNETTLDAGNGFSSYLWSDGSTNSTLAVGTSGTFAVTVTDANGCTGMASQSVTESQSLNPVISGTLDFCVGLSTELDAGTGFDSYTWSDGSNAQTLLVDEAGTYAVTVSDASGCTGTTEVLVEENNLPVVNILGNIPICEGESIVLDAGNGYANYLWSDNSLNQELEVNAGGTYSVTVVNAAGCLNAGAVTVVENQNPAPVIGGPTEFCEGNSVTLDLAVDYDNYLWSDGSAGEDLMVTDGGTYAVTVTDANGCQGIAQLNVIENTATPPTIDGTLNFCEGESTNLQAVAGYTNYVWSNGAIGSEINIDMMGTYTVTVTDQNTCTSTASVSVMENQNPVPTIAGSATFCLGSSTILDAGGGYATYLWSDGTFGQTLEIDQPGTYSVTVTNQNGCGGNTDFTVSQSAELTPVISGDLNFCIGDNTLLDAGSGFDTYTWSDGTFGQNITVDQPGTYAVTVTDASGCSGTAEVLVGQSTLPVVNISGNVPICEGEMILLDAGVGFDTYTWSTGALNQSLAVSEPGIYSVTVTDANACSNVTQVELVVNPNPEPTIDGASSFCTGNSTVLSSNNFASYLWSNNSTEASITVTEGGTYDLTVTDINACVGTTSIVVTENESLTPIIDGDPSICIGENTLLDAGSGYATYLWSDGSVEQTLQVNSTGTYEVTVSDANACTGETALSVVVNDNPEPSIAGSATFCIGTSTILDAGAGYSSYEWSNGTQTQTNEVAIAGTYELTVTDANGCVGTTAFTVSESQSLEPVISGDLDFCNGESTVLDAGAGFDTYIWSNGDPGQSIQVDLPGTYSVTVTDLSGCSGIADVVVLENQLPNLSIAGNNPICAGATVMLDAGAGFASYVWSNGNLNPTLEVDEAGLYAVTVVDANGCSSEDQVLVEVNPNPEPQISGSSTFCSGTFTALDGGSGFSTYQWSNGLTTSMIEVSSPGLIGLTVTDVNGCVGETSLLIEESANLNPQIVGDPLICEGGSTILDVGLGFDTYQWSNGDLGQSIQVDLPGDYSITVTDASGCSGEANIMVIENSPPFADVLPTANTCNTNAGGSLLDFSQFILAGDLGGQWLDVDASGAMGTFPQLDFDGVAAGSYTFTYTTNSAQVPCTDQTYTTIVVVAECACPPVNFNAADPLCNIDGQLDLDDLILNGGTGTWTIAGAPAGPNPANLTGSVFDASGANVGIYDLNYILDGPLPPGCNDVFSTQLSVDPALSAGLANPPLDFCSDATMSVDLANELIGADLGGLWTETSDITSTNNAFDPVQGIFDMSNQLPGIYTFQYSLAANGACPGDDATVTVFVHELPIAEAGMGTELDCNVNEFTLDAMGSSVGSAFQYTWDGPGVILDGNSLTPTINAPGIFTLTILNTLTGCTSSDVVEVTQNANVPVATVGPDNELNCDSSSVVLFGGSVAGSNDYTWQWSGPGIDNSNMSQQYPVVSVAGTYTLVIMDVANNCSSSPVLVEVIDNTAPPSVIVDLPLAILDCNINAVELNGSASVGSGVLTYQWLDDDGQVLTTDPILNVNQPGNYTLLVTDEQSGCVASDQLEVVDNTVIPTADSGNPQHLDCAAIEAELDASASSIGAEIVYTWLDATGAIVQGPSQDPTVMVSSPGNYQLLVTDESNGCTSQSIVEVTQDITPPNIEVANIDQLDCTVNEVVLDASNSSSGAQFTYQWSDAFGNLLSSQTSTVVGAAGNYQFTIINTTNQCVETTQVAVSENSNLPNDALLDISPPTCFGDNDASIEVIEVLGGTAPFVYCIDGGPYTGVDQFTSLSEGSYSICLQDAVGCTWDTLITIQEPPALQLDLGLDVQIQLGDSTQLTASFNIPQSNVDTLIWTPAALLNCDNEDCYQPTTNIVDAAVFEALLIDIDGCVADASVQVDVIKDRLIYIPSAFSPNDDQNNDLFMIHGGIGVEQVNVFRVYNRWGEQVFGATNFRPDDPVYGWDGTFRGQPLNPAVFVYYAEVEFEDGHKELFKGDVTLLK